MFWVFTVWTTIPHSTEMPILTWNEIFHCYLWVPIDIVALCAFNKYSYIYWNTGILLWKPCNLTPNCEEYIHVSLSHRDLTQWRRTKNYAFLSNHCGFSLVLHGTWHTRWNNSATFVKLRVVYVLRYMLLSFNSSSALAATFTSTCFMCTEFLDTKLEW
jgi:hypothetical protein